MPPTAWGWEITPAELESWILEHTPQWLVLNKPPYVVCHPSKRGPWSSLAGACREYLGLERVHMPFRLDRETSGVVVIAKDPATASQMQRAVQQRRVRKIYLAILTGELGEAVTVDAPIGRLGTTRVAIRQGVIEGGQRAVTRFIPLHAGGGYTLARVEPETGRLHQIRVHAAHIGHAIAGDKIYGPDESLFLEFVEEGYTSRLAARLHSPHHLLHRAEVRFDPAPAFPEGLHFQAALPQIFASFTGLGTSAA
jgi:23S rRNA pseudouridine1911/1915/1917 synthase